MTIPKEVKEVIGKLEKKGFEAYAVGGCVRDFLLEKEPEDWDIATSARPEEIQEIFPDNFYENRFFTVTVRTKSRKERLKEIEVTTFRSEAKYTDKRHPDEIQFAKTIEEDLARRDFTINAMALKVGKVQPKSSFIDPFYGQNDLKERIIRAVGNPGERFEEDALRMVRAVRFAATLSVEGKDWEIEEKTRQAIKKNSSDLRLISQERVRDELVKIIMSDKAAQGIDLLRQMGLMEYIIPELLEGCGVGQNKHHIYECYDHNLRSLAFAAKKKFNKYVRIASLLHDIGKPRSKKGEGPDSTFYNHEMIGAKMAEKVLERLKFPKKETEKIVKLVRYHLFYYNVDEVSESSVRRLVSQVGTENMEELLQVRMSDRIGSGVPKAEPYKLRHLKYIIEKVSLDPISVKMLKISGHEVMKLLSIPPGPKVGQVLDILLGQVLIDPKKNKKEYLEKEAIRLGVFSEKDLISLAEKGRKEREDLEMKRDEMTKGKYWVT